MQSSALQSEILWFIIENGYQPGDQLPTIQEISEVLGISVAKTREALEVARFMGVVEIRPGRGTRVADYRFAPVMTISALYAIGQDAAHFEHLRQFRNALELHFWSEAASHLSKDEIALLRDLVERAGKKLEQRPIQVPTIEHRAFHVAIFEGLGNPFVLGVVEAFWEAYVALGLNLYVDLDYHRQVWNYHERIVDAIQAGDIEQSRQLFIEHIELLDHRAARDRFSPRRSSDRQPIRFE